MTPGTDRSRYLQFKWALSAFRARVRGSTRHGKRVFGVGAAKTGTHSLGQMFSNRVRSAHEEDIEKLIHMHLDRVQTCDDRVIRRFLARRDIVRDLKIDASHLNIYLIDDFEALFPGSLYVMTVRHPVDWLRSFIDDSLRRDTSQAFKLFRNYRFDPSRRHPPEEKPLLDRGLYTISGYLEYWRSAIEIVTEKIPGERLLSVRTEELGGRSDEIARFCGIDGGGVDEGRSKAFVNKERFGVLSEVPREYLNDRLNEICGPLLESYFPDSPGINTLFERQ